MLVRPAESEKAVPPANVIDWLVLSPEAEMAKEVTFATGNDVVPDTSPASVMVVPSLDAVTASTVEPVSVKSMMI